MPVATIVTVFAATAVFVTLLPESPTSQVAPTVPTPRPVRDYNLLIMGEKSSWQGQEIRSNGFCIEIVLNDRVDTIVCGSTVITEVPEDAQPQVPELPTATQQTSNSAPDRDTVTGG